MVSIVLPTYNGEKYIRESIQSIINQTYTEWELIVIDDCSLDSTNSIVAEYVEKDKRIKLFKNEQNLRLPASLNAGFLKASGDYLTWTSDDNLYKPEALEKMLDALQRDANCGLVFSRMENIDGEGMLKGLSCVPRNVRELYYHNIVGASFMYTRKVYEQIGDYDTGKFLMEDYDYWLRIARSFEIEYLPEVLYQYRQHECSLTETRNRQVLEGKVKLLEEELTLAEFENDILRMIYKELAEALFSLDQYAEMKEYLLKMRSISKDMSDVRRAVRISYVLGSTLSAVMKRIFKRKKNMK
ncbi:MAG: glycosyltransferase [Acetatifactor sp.]|nr:glycosyltransferase [Acetatifactor sp.]